MNPENQRHNAEEELSTAAEALREAETLFRDGLLRGAASRGCYALFHAVRALLFSKGLEAGTHHGVETLFHLHFVRPQEVHPEWGTVFIRLHGYRERADYGPAVPLPTAEVRRELDNVTRFLGVARERIG